MTERYIVRAFNETGLQWLQKQFSTDWDLERYIEIVRTLCPESKITIVDLKESKVDYIERATSG